jgi:hypothetical protein
MEIPSIHSTQLYSQAAHLRRPGVKFFETESPKTARDQVTISNDAQNRLKALETLNSILDLKKNCIPALSLHSPQALGEMMNVLSARGIAGLR